MTVFLENVCVFEFVFIVDVEGAGMFFEEVELTFLKIRIGDNVHDFLENGNLVIC